MIPRYGKTAVLLAMLLPSAWVLHAQEQSVRPGVNAPYEEADVELWRGRFEREGREVYDKRAEIVAETGLRPGMVVADIGAGTGLFTREFSRAVRPGGRVYAVDIAPAFVEDIRRLARIEGLDNVLAIQNTEHQTALPPDSIDLAFLCDVYHHFEYPQDMLASILASLRPGGRMVLIDFRRTPGRSRPWVLQHVRADAATVIAEVEAAGFELERESPILAENYFLVFEKPR